MTGTEEQAPTVYLDHLIQRESLRYIRSEATLVHDARSSAPSPAPELGIRELNPVHQYSKVMYLRKPDFQRATCSWTAKDCVYLLESIIEEQVVPSIVMWKSPDELNYILDGAHRVSAIIAWLTDDWGDRVEFPGSEEIEDCERDEHYKKSAKEVRRLVKEKIGSLKDFEAAERTMTQLQREGKTPNEVMPDLEFKRALFYRRYHQGEVRLHILWVKGDYEMAEQSFLRINKGGKKLTDWETRVVEDRNSSFVRSIMSVANVSSVRHYWPQVQTAKTPVEEKLQQKVSDIHGNVADLRTVLFTPSPPKKFVPDSHPFFFVPSIAEKPSYLAELLCVTAGFRGQQAEIDRLIAADREAGTADIITNGWATIRQSLDTFSHLTGPSPRSLGIVPLLYFYTDKGKHVRSLLYGFISWLTHGTPEMVLQRKRTLSAHREAFEQVLLMRKDDIVRGVSRKTGSGSDVTNSIAQYYQRLMEALIRHENRYETDAFAEEYRSFTKPLVSKETAAYKDLDGRGRIFSAAQKSAVLYQTFFGEHPHCGICGGAIDFYQGVQHDHIIDFAQGGKTVQSNQRPVHPFCNNPQTKQLVEAVKARTSKATLPAFVTG